MPAERKLKAKKGKAAPELQDSCTQYVKNYSISVPEDGEFEILDSGLIFDKISNRTTPASNKDHIIFLHHRPTSTLVVACYIARVSYFKRPLGKLRSILEPVGFRQVKLTNKEQTKSPALQPFVRYLPDFIQDPEPRVRKAKHETFASFFTILTKSGDSTTVLTQLSNSKKIREDDFPEDMQQEEDDEDMKYDQYGFQTNYSLHHHHHHHDKRQPAPNLEEREKEAQEALLSILISYRPQIDSSLF
jgi:hypothetical protein